MIFREISLTDLEKERDEMREKHKEGAEERIKLVEAYWNQVDDEGLKRKYGNRDEYELALQHAEDGYYRTIDQRNDTNNYIRFGFNKKEQS